MLTLLAHSTLAALSLATFAPACGDDEPIIEDSLVALQVVEQGWSGWSEEQPEPATTDYQVAAGQRLVLGIGSLTATLDVETVTDDVVRIRVDGAAIVSPSGGFDLDGCGEHTVRLAEGESVELATCTLDGGTSWTVTSGG